MEVPGMVEANKEGHLTSASAFVEGGVQEACEDACSICLEVFCKSDPPTVTGCKHEFHLQCILEWSQRSSNCPMCWQSISLKDPSSQELVEAVERERRFRFNSARNSAIFHRPTLGDFELQHLPVNSNDTELEERIIQHLAAAAAMGRAHHVSQRNGPRSRPSAHNRPHFLVFSTHPSSPPAGPVSLTTVRGERDPASVTGASPAIPLTAGVDDRTRDNPQLSSVPRGRISASASRSTVMPINRPGISINNKRNFASQSSLPNPDRAGPSEFHSLSNSWKSRFNAMSIKYKDSISKSTKAWKEKLFSRSNSMADIGSEVRREVNAGIANVSRMMECLETGKNDRAGRVSLSNNLAESSATEQSNHNNVETQQEAPSTDNRTAAYATSSVSH